MGLPSGNRWAVSNLDATGPYYFQESPFQYECSFFSWGNVTPHNLISETEFDYNFGRSNPAAPYYEGQPYGETPGSLLTGNIPLTDDAARKMLGSPWLIPSNEDFQELFANTIYIDANGDEVVTTNKIVSVNGVAGVYLQSKYNGARLFFACTGYGRDSSLLYQSLRGYYWSSARFSSQNAQALYFNSSLVQPMYRSNPRSNGYPIRPIWNPRDLK